MFTLSPVTYWMPSSKSESKSFCEIYPLSANSLPYRRLANTSNTAGSLSLTFALVRTKAIISPLSLQARCCLNPWHHPMWQCQAPLHVYPLHPAPLLQGEERRDTHRPRDAADTPQHLQTERHRPERRVRQLWGEGGADREINDLLSAEMGMKESHFSSFYPQKLLKRHVLKSISAIFILKSCWNHIILLYLQQKWG